MDKERSLVSYITLILNPELHTSEREEVNRQPDRKQEDAAVKLRE